MILVSSCGISSTPPGIALGLAWGMSVQESADNKRAAFWFLRVWVAVTMMAHIVFYKIDKRLVADAEAAAASASADSVTTDGAVSEKL